MSLQYGRMVADRVDPERQAPVLTHRRPGTVPTPYHRHGQTLDKGRGQCYDKGRKSWGDFPDPGGGSGRWPREN
jgi:hypothetical protein